MLRGIKFTKEVILIGATGLFAFLMVVLLLSSFFPSSSHPADTLPTPTPNTILTTREERYPTAKPQAFFQSIPTNATGSLIVTTSTPKVWVYLDPPEDTHAEAPENPEEIKGENVPPQYPPFRIDTLPVGKHRLIAASELNFMAQDMEIEIKKDEITRVHIELKPM